MRLRFYVRERLYHLLWVISRKKVLRIGEENIEYVSLPHWMLYSGSDANVKWGEGQVIAHRRTKNLIILISQREPAKEKRYTIYHEYIEGCCLLRQGIAKDTKSIEVAWNDAIKELGVSGSSFEKDLLDYIKRTKEWPHALALVMELLLFNRENDHERFKTYLLNRARSIQKPSST